MTGAEGTMSWDEVRLAYFDSDQTDVVQVRAVSSEGSRVIPLPTAVDIDGPLIWESDTRLLVEVQAGGKDRNPDTLLRCSAETARCELATQLPQGVALPIR